MARWIGFVLQDRKLRFIFKDAEEIKHYKDD